MEKEEKILAAALKLFVERGFHGTPTSQIAKAAGVANGTLFHYFNTKEGLINALYLRIKDEMIRNTLAHLPQEVDIKTQLQYIWEQNIDWALNHPEKLHFIQQFSYSPYISTLTKAEADQLKTTYWELLQNGIKQGLFKDLPIDLLYLHASQQLYGLLQYLRLHPEQTKDQSFQQKAFELLWSVLSNDQSTTNKHL